ncbi:tripartite tricarboxylate transporter TctB family protein [Anaerobacillus sp. MEB173]|uniref:tripartite tricarboxylate transporter TctB family protein n=1 Tax=Anaerobacillus sp. MEB173 TaxID=3383345 RepID=UPI003F935E5F
MIKKFQDVYASVFLIGVAVIMYMATYNIQALTVSNIGADFMPRLIAISLFILSTIMLIGAIKKLKTPDHSKVIEEEESETEDEGANQKINIWSVVATIGLMIGYVYLLPTIGFLIMTTVYLFLQMIVLADKAYRRITLFIVISIISSAAIYFLFKSVFYLRLPAGILG